MANQSIRPKKLIRRKKNLIKTYSPYVVHFSKNIKKAFNLTFVKIAKRLKNIKNIFDQLIRLASKQVHILVYRIKTPRKSKQEIKAEIDYKIFSEWDSFPSPYPTVKKSFFSGRKELVDKLTHWLLDSNGGSILVSGVRGVGKTAFVYYSISKIYGKFQNNGFSIKLKTLGYLQKFIGICWEKIRNVIKLISNPRKIIFVPINTALFKKTYSPNNDNNRKPDNNEDQKERKINESNQEILLHFIIASLHLTQNLDKKFKAKIDRLYYFSIGESKTDKIHQEDLSKESNAIYNLALSAPIFFTLLTFSIIALLHYNPPLLRELIKYDYLSYLLQAAPYITGIISITTFIKLKKRQLQTNIENVSYRPGDYNYLFSELNNALCKNYDNIIFVFDEIDKFIYNNRENPDVSDSISFDNLIRDLKNLFTISSGKFIFISNDEYAHHLLDDQNNEKNPYPLNSTYFNWMIFIPNISITDISNYIKSLYTSKKIDKKPLDEEILIFSAYVYALSGGVFIKIKNIIRDHIKYINNQPELHINLISTNDRKIARLGYLLFNCYEQNLTNRPSDYRLNFLIHETLYAVFQEILETGTESTIKTSINSWCEKYKLRGYEKLKPYEKQLVKYKLLDLLSDIKKYAGKNPIEGIVIPNDVKEDTEISFGLQLSSVNTVVDDLISGRLRLSTNETNFYSKFNSLKLINKQMEYRFFDILDLIDSSYINEYTQAEILFKQIQEKINGTTIQYLEQKQIVMRTNTIEKITQTLKDKLLTTYLDLILPKYFFYELVDKIAIVKKINKITKTKYYIKSSLVKLTDRHTNKSFYIATQNINNELMAFVSKKNQLSAYLSYKDIQEVSNKILNYFNITKRELKPYETTPNPKNEPWRYDCRIIYLPLGKFIKQIEFEVNPKNEYWRAGIMFGSNSNELQPKGTKGLNNDTYPLIHLYKDENQTEIKYRRYTPFTEYFDTLLESSIPKLFVKIETVNSTDQSTIIVVNSNQKEIDRFNIDNFLLNKCMILTWADSHDCEIEIKKVIVKF